MTLILDSWWERSVEKLLKCTEVSDYPLNSTYTVAANPITPGMVAVLLDGEWCIADDLLADGAFHGLFYSSFNAAANEIADGINPVVLVGPGTVRVKTPALDAQAVYATNAADAVELIAQAGILTPRAAEVTPTVAILEVVEPNGDIIVHLNAPSS